MDLSSFSYLGFDFFLLSPSQSIVSVKEISLARVRRKGFNSVLHCTALPALAPKDGLLHWIQPIPTGRKVLRAQGRALQPVL